MLTKGWGCQDERLNFKGLNKRLCDKKKVSVSNFFWLPNDVAYVTFVCVFDGIISVTEN